MCEEQVSDSGYKFTYGYPNDCVCARDLFLKNDFSSRKFSIISLSNGMSAIVTDIENPILRYTRRVDKEVFFTCEFAMALSFYLASLTANVLVGSAQKGEIAWDKYTKLLKHAKVVNAYETNEIIYETEEYLNARN